MSKLIELIAECEDITVWPFKRADEAPTLWHEMTEKDWWYCLEVLPPIYFAGGFAVSEAYGNDEQGRATYWCCVQVGSRYFGKHMAVAEMPAAARELRDRMGQ